MADEAVFSFLLQKCSDYLEPEVVKWLQKYNVDKKVRTLKEKVEWVDAYLKDAQKLRDAQNREGDINYDAQNGGGNERERLWINKITEIADEADEAIANFIDMAKRTGWGAALSSFLFMDNPLRKAAQDMDCILERLAETISNKAEFGI